MNTPALNPGDLPRRSPSVERGFRLPARGITLPHPPFQAFVTAISQMRDRRFTKSVTA